ncbi:hypothetical protein [Flavobacterium sp. ASV13]|nr:hypothetical protein [Flavobacterium sp. ASV13]
MNTILFSCYDDKYDRIKKEIERAKSNYTDDFPEEFLSPPPKDE